MIPKLWSTLQSLSTVLTNASYFSGANVTPWGGEPKSIHCDTCTSYSRCYTMVHIDCTPDTHTHTHSCSHVHNVDTHSSAHVHTHAPIHTYSHALMHSQSHTHTHTHKIHTHTLTHTHTHTHTRKHSLNSHTHRTGSWREKQKSEKESGSRKGGVRTSECLSMKSRSLNVGLFFVSSCCPALLL